MGSIIAGTRKNFTMMRFGITNPVGVPAGCYKARFQDVSRVPLNDGFGVRLQFTPIDGPYAGCSAKRLVPEIACPTNATGRLIGGLTGVAVVPKTVVDVEPCLGRIYTIEIEETPDGASTRVVNVSPVEG